MCKQLFSGRHSQVPAYFNHSWDLTSLGQFSLNHGSDQGVCLEGRRAFSGADNPPAGRLGQLSLIC
jgi:hypothetical protein